MSLHGRYKLKATHFNEMEWERIKELVRHYHGVNEI